MTALGPSVLLLVLALLLDLAVGDPPWLPHPTRVMGAGIGALEKLFWRPNASRGYLLAMGGMIVICIVGASWTITWGLLAVASRINYWVEVLLAGWLLATTIAPRGLAGAALGIGHSLAVGDLLRARQQVGYIVGRDTANLSEGEVVRATVETVAENTSDGVIAPLFYFFLGGVPLAMAYRAVNTLDSMLGYKNDRYLFFGRAAARLDDLANYLPARLTGIALCVAAALLGYGWRAWTIMLRDARRHPSPNSGFPEAAVAGALGVQLGGLNYYQGIPSRRPLIGEARQGLRKEHIWQAVYLMVGATVIAALAGGLILALKGNWY
ncbi:adenosylcobinamide-phosphate synthase CbiB [Neomoorella mulderi]|uniref:adenosylcobinamide-phosphate synthase CbiB n=1 Tax=Neomoorella mulderi TaxID=202604 RepID=UPI001F02BEC2|nr:adenosylcobinamide-phosphate synthase CbiB [Moorella mulderi]